MLCIFTSLTVRNILCCSCSGIHTISLSTFPTSDTTTKAKDDAKDFWVNMPNLITHLKKVAEQKPQATYYNVDMLKYQVSLVYDHLAEQRWYCCSKLCVLKLCAGVM